MYFSTWLEKNKVWITAFAYCVCRDKVLKYVQGKNHPKAKEIEKEILSEPKDVIWIPIDVWKDEYYKFK